MLAILVVALTLAVAVSLVGLSAWSAIERQASAVSDNYVTIAIMNDEWGNPYYDEAALEAAVSTGCVVREDSRCMLGVEVENSRALTSGAIEQNDYEYSFDSPSYCLAVIAVTCDSIRVGQSANGFVVIDDEEFELPSYETYDVEATVNEVVSLAEGYERPKNGDAISFEGIYLSDGTIPIQIGKTYLVFGYYQEPPIVYKYYQDTDPVTGEYTWTVREEPDSNYSPSLGVYDNWVFSIRSPELNIELEGSPYELDKYDLMGHTMLGQREDGTFYYYPMPDCSWTHFAEHTGSVEDFLKSEAGREWREEIIPRCESNQRSASMVLTDNLQDIYMFNNGFGEVIEGREMNPEEYVDGDDVCIVSVEYAKYNNLHVGDRISVDYYDTTVVQASVSESGTTASEISIQSVYRHGVLTQENRLGVKKDYEIVGIYSAPAFRGGTHLFTADTIFAPKKSLPNAEKYEERGIRALQSLVLRNGSEEEFFEGLKHCRYEGEYDWEFEDPNDIDFSGDFMTFNQQYDKAAGNIEVMRSNARRLLILAILGFLIVLAAVRYFEARRQRVIVVTMKKLGIARRRIVRELIGAGLLLDLTATVFGGLAAWLLFGEITRRANVGTLQLPLTTLLISAAATAIVLTLTTVFSASRLSRIALMETKK